jgi:CubicO group peptidase (beta-lactamase class C family)
MMKSGICAVMFGSLIAASSTLAGPAHAKPRPNPAFDACFAAQSKVAPFTGVALGIQGASRFVRAAGHVNGTRSPTAITQYRLASVGKLFTQVAIGQLIDQRRIDQHVPIGTYLRQLPPELAVVTVDQLLHHQSGVAPNLLFSPDTVAVMQRANSATDLLPLVVNQPLAFTPGSQMQYSNGGYYVLGAIIEAVSGMLYKDYLQQKIFRPLGMSSSSLSAGPATAPRMSRMSGPGQPPLAAPAPIVGMPDLPGSPAGDAVASANDLARFASALLGNRLLSDATKQTLYPRRPGGWRIGQAGGAPGGNTYFMLYPEANAAIVTLSNEDPPGGELMGEALGVLLSAGTCRPLSPSDRPSPLRIIKGPPPPGS